MHRLADAAFNIFGRVPVSFGNMSGREEKCHPFEFRLSCRESHLQGGLGLGKASLSIYTQETKEWNLVTRIIA